MSTLDSIEGGPARTIINESGLYDVVLQSRKPEAKEFRRWITSEVLPSIRKHGGYLTSEKIEEVLLNPDTLIQLATNLKEEQEARALAESRLEEVKPIIAYHDDFIKEDDLLSFRTVASSLNVKESALREWLIEHKWIYRERAKNDHEIFVNRYSEYATHKQDFKRIENHIWLFNGETYHTLKFTQRGAARLAAAFNKEAA